MSSMSNSRELGTLFNAHSKKRPRLAQHSYDSDVRQLVGGNSRHCAGVPGRAMAGAPGRYMLAEEPHKDKEDKVSPKYNPIVRKLYYPSVLSIRFPDNNKIPTVNVGYANFATVKVGVDCPPTPYFLFLPAHNTGLFLAGGTFTRGGVTRYLPSSILPAARDLTSFTLARNLASRIAVRSGTISSTNVALSGTFNACAFYTVRDFKKFDVAEFSTHCISGQDYVQGVRSDNGVVLISGPEMVPELRPILTSESYSDKDNMRVNLTVTPPKGKSDYSIYNYFADATTLNGPLIHDREFTFRAETVDNKPLLSGQTTNSFVTLNVEYSLLKPDNTVATTYVEVRRVAFTYVYTGLICFETSVVVKPPPVFIGFVTGVHVFFDIDAASNGTVPVFMSLSVPMQFDAGNLGPGFVVAAVGFQANQEIVLDVTRSLEAVPSGALLQDLKADMGVFVPTKHKMLERAIMAFNTPGNSIRRVYTRSDFYLFTTTAAGGSGRSEQADLSTFNSEDRIMGGPISGLIKTLTPVLSAIPGIGPMAGLLGGIAGSVADITGFCGPPLDSDLREVAEETAFDADVPMALGVIDNGEETYAVEGTHPFQLGESEADGALSIDLLYDLHQLDRCADDPSIFSVSQVHGYAVDMEEFGNNFIVDLFLSYGNSFVPENQATINEMRQQISYALGDVKSSQRYQLAKMGAPVLTDPVVASNVVGISGDGTASIENIFISDGPMNSINSENEYINTTYHEVILSDKNRKEIDVCYVSDDFSDAASNPGVTDALYTIFSALIWSGRSKARGIQYITLPRPGIVAGPSLGIATTVACLGIIDEFTVFSGGVVLREGQLQLTPILGTLAKAAEVVRNGMVLVCSTEKDLESALDKRITRSDGTVAFPYVRASSMPAGIPVNNTKAIVATTILEALSVGHTLVTGKEILKIPAKQLEATKAKNLLERETKTRERENMLHNGVVDLPESLMKCYGLEKPPTIAEFKDLPLDADFTYAMSDLKEAARTNITRLKELTFEKLGKGDLNGAYNGLTSLGDLLLRKLLKDQTAEESGTTGKPGQTTLGQSLALLSRKRNAVPKEKEKGKEAPAAAKPGVNIRPKTAIPGPRKATKLKVIPGQTGNVKKSIRKPPILRKTLPTKSSKPQNPFRAPVEMEEEEPEEEYEETLEENLASAPAAGGSWTNFFRRN